MSEMPEVFFLDTNAYAMIFQNPPPLGLSQLQLKINNGGVMEFFLPEIVSMEIHSVLGKYRRGGASTRHEQCTKEILLDTAFSNCSHTCVFRGRNRMKIKVYRAFLKILDDIENKRGYIRGEIVPTIRPHLQLAKDLLIKYADRYAFGSHDAMVAGVVKEARSRGVNGLLVTSDKALKAVCNDEGIPTFDPALFN
ncbi:hypothetical protein [Janthinobacterium sp. BJB446]|uniref:hypothetical protein n=1 Tax=Janthinobacterium sp. BJB446 TaxID=2048009 RepID=UPI00117B45DD|nr:hypothetical protein [Janthinobacterium sp. BJB446]